MAAIGQVWDRRPVNKNGEPKGPPFEDYTFGLSLELSFRAYEEEATLCREDIGQDVTV